MTGYPLMRGRRSKGRQINRHGGFHNPGCKIVVGGAPPCLGASQRQGKSGTETEGMTREQRQSSGAS
jgi:hypothetical protein